MNEEIVCRPDVFTGCEYPNQTGTCLVIMPFKEETLEEEHIQDVYRDHIKKVAEECGLACKRADNDDVLAGKARMNQIWQMMCAADIIIGEFTIPNINVTYEMGIAHTLGKPMIGIVRKGSELPFDYQHLGFVVYQDTTKGHTELEKALKKQIQGYLKEITPDNQYPKRVGVSGGVPSIELDNARKRIIELEGQLRELQADFRFRHQDRAHAEEIARLTKELEEAKKRHVPAPALPPKSKFINGEWTNLYRFGELDWLVLDVDEQEERVLLLAKDIVERREYQEGGGPTTWEKCSLRKYLNGEYLEKFSRLEWAMIYENDNENPDNQWHKDGTGCGKTKDQVFLLNITEVVKYFGDSGQLKNKNPTSKYWIDDQYNYMRTACFHDFRNSWWLRSPGSGQYSVAYIDNDGYIRLTGGACGLESGVRPALWLNL